MPDMPDAGIASYLLEYLFEIGPTMAGAAGAAAITHQEIAAWQQLSRVRLSPWEAHALRSLSREFVAAAHLAEKADAKAPWLTETTPADRAAVAQTMRDSLRRLAQM